jgi:hypothetical protein
MRDVLLGPKTAKLLFPGKCRCCLTGERVQRQKAQIMACPGISKPWVAQSYNELNGRRHGFIGISGEMAFLHDKKGQVLQPGLVSI